MKNKKVIYTERLVWRKSKQGGEYASYSVGIIRRRNGVYSVNYPTQFRFLKIRNVKHAKDIIDAYREKLINEMINRRLKS